MDITWIQNQVRKGEYLWSLHADEERRNDGLEIRDVEGAILNGKILESYPEDLRGRSCLIHGDFEGSAVHIVCGRNKAGTLVIITVYRPNWPKWKSPLERNPK